MAFCFKRVPIIFSDRDSVSSTLDTTIPNIGESCCFKVCNFCGPYTSHSDGCKSAIELFKETNPDYQTMTGFNEWLNSFRLGAGFMNRESKSVVIFLSTVSRRELETTFRKIYELFAELFGE